MSGGSLNYFYCSLEEHVGDFGDKELDDLVADLAELFHDREWRLSYDIGDGEWREKRDAFKKKWFTDCGRKERIEKYLNDISNDVREMFGMSDKRCKNCDHWSKRGDSKYRKCSLMNTCLMHRSESCDRFVKEEL